MAANQRHLLNLLAFSTALCGLIIAAAPASADTTHYPMKPPSCAAPDEQIAWAKEYLARVERGEINSATQELAGLAADPGQIIYVRQAATGANDGSNWTNAYNDLQDALASATAGDEIWVAAGTYRPDPNGDPNAVFELVDQVNVYGGFAGTEMQRGQREPNTYETILSGDLNGDDQPDFGNRDDNSLRILEAQALSPLTTLDGFMIRGGGPSERPHKDERKLVGGGIAIYGGGLTILDCRFEDNQTYYAGHAIYVSNASLRLEGCFIANNHMAYADTIYNSRGGAVYGQGAYLNVIHCEFDSNSTRSGSGITTTNSDTLVTLTDFSNSAGISAQGLAVHAGGGNQQYIGCHFNGHPSLAEGTGRGVSLSHSNTTDDLSESVLFYECTFVNNAGYFGSVIDSLGDLSLTISNCGFYHNIGGVAGAVRVSRNFSSREPNIYIADSVFSGNAAAINGAAELQGATTIVRSVFDGNECIVGSAPGAIYIEGDEIVLRDCDFLDNTGTRGGALEVESDYLQMSNCSFIGNFVPNDNSGAALLITYELGWIENCRFIGNETAAANYAGGAFTLIGKHTVVNTLFSGNRAKRDGTVLSLGNRADFINCTFANYRSDQTLFSLGFTAKIFLHNCILGSPADEFFSPDSGIVNVTDSLFLGGFPNGTNIIDADPNFADPMGPDGIAGTEDDDLRLTASSAALDAGVNEWMPFEVLSDLDGNPRFTNCTVDLGAYEYPQAGPSPEAGDFNGDCAINTSDLELLVACWSGPDVLLLEADCLARDLDQVGVSDIDLHDYARLQVGP